MKSPLVVLMAFFHYSQPQQLTNSMCGSPESQSSSCHAGQTGFYGSTPLQYKSNMPSPPYTPYDQSPPQTQQYVDTCLMGTPFQDYQGFTPDTLAPVSTSYPPQYVQEQYGNRQYMQQCPLPTAQLHGVGMSVPNQLQTCSVNPTFAMQATVFTASPSSSTLCYQPPNLTDLQFPAEPQVYPSYNTVLSECTTNPVDRTYVNNARERYSRVACAAPNVHVGSKRPRETPPTQTHGVSDWSSQWLQGVAPPAHVY